jgi:hypothetical protein
MIGIGVCAALIGLLLVAYRGEPRFQSDQGVFLSVAARMLDGDRLYAEVADNKDPLFFYTYAAALWVGGWKGPFALDGIWLTLAALSMALLLRAARLPFAAVVGGALVYPLALTAGWYQPGLSMLAALAIAPFAGWLWLRGSLATAGAAVGVVMLFKLNLAAVAAAPLAAFLAFGRSGIPRRRQIVLSVLGLGLTLVIAAAVLGLRGELAAYMETVAYNVGYSSRGLYVDSPIDAISGHVRIVREYFAASGRWQAPAAVLVAVCFVGSVAIGWRMWRKRSIHVLGAAAVLTLAVTLMTLALTVIWTHHLQALAYPAALMAASAISMAAAWLGRGTAAAGAIACVAFAGWASMGEELRAGLSTRAWSAEPFAEPAAALDDARESYPARDRITYMVFGGNSENAHAAFISDDFDLSCRWFHLYPFSVQEQFEETIECLERERPLLVLVTLNFVDSGFPYPEWGMFVSRARRLLMQRYRLVREVHPGFEIWKRIEQRHDD